MTLPTGTLYTISAPSGAGKTSLVAKLLETCDNLRVSVSHTTRPKREGEQPGVNYHFTSEQEFLDLMANGAFLEHAKVFNHYYGTSEAWVREQLTAGTDVILEIDWQGAAQVRRLMPECIGIFILPPSLQALSQRLTGRGKDAPEVIRHRLEQAQLEISHNGEADFLVVNDDFDTALRELQSIVINQRLTTPRQQQKYAQLLRELLS